ncbi:nicotinate (nicotinamide) nucleotide adenylyltransferase [candidate division WOR-3 bacterium]|nr:nicotinate (nicotinamide) nucleotide adenylyltransferase [candidate division WOR-3 bacterium]
MRLGVLGGTFNPVHLGHLLVADDARRALGLDRVGLIPAFNPPLRRGRVAPYRHRLAMLRLALRGWDGLELLPLEESRPGPSYTVATLRDLRDRFPGARRWLLVGADQYRQMAGWHEPGRLTDHARIAVLTRPGIPLPPVFPGHDPRRVRFVEIIPVGLSGSLVRCRLARGRSVRYMLPGAVDRYVRRHGLFAKPTRSRQEV